DQVFDPADDVQLVGDLHAEVAGTHVLAPVVGELGGERLLRQLLAVPVPDGNARPGDPDLAGGTGWARPQLVRVDDDHLAVGDAGSATEENGRRFAVGRYRDTVLAQASGRHLADSRLARPVADAD